MSNQIEEFFKRDGAIGLILTIGLDDARFKEIESQVAVSHDTVSNRIDEARNMGLIKTEPASGVGTEFTNILTETGTICYKGMKELDLEEAHTEYIDAKRKRNKLSGEYTQKVGDEHIWLEWVLDIDVSRDTLMRRFKHRGEDAAYVVNSQFPEQVNEALKQQSLDPLKDIDDRDYWLWKLMKYPPEPDEKPDADKYIQDSDSHTDPDTE